MTGSVVLVHVTNRNQPDTPGSVLTTVTTLTDAAGISVSTKFSTKDHNMSPWSPFTRLRGSAW
jgi:hypothetical protein